MADLPSNRSNRQIVKRKPYVYQAEKQSLKGLSELSYSPRELKLLGLIRPELKDKYGEASARVIHALILRLRTDPNCQSFSNQELIVASKQLADTVLALESSPDDSQAKIDWSKFDTTKFNESATKPDIST